jgi:hypothetical protein
VVVVHVVHAITETGARTTVKGRSRWDRWKGGGGVDGGARVSCAESEHILKSRVKREVQDGWTVMDDKT